MTLWHTTLDTPLGPMLAAASDQALTGLWFIGQAHFPAVDPSWKPGPDRELFTRLRTWLDAYFSGAFPEVDIPLSPLGTAFRQSVWSLLREIHPGATTTYGDLARRLYDRPGQGKGYARAVGGAVARNPISILIPCHRVLGSGGSLTGYAGGIERKQALLDLETRGRIS
jgi:methylated-DNA-[protein]-cysteine S-methyltransferase